MPRIHDPIYGYVDLDDYEKKLVDTPLIQRLHGIKQQGTAYLVYPSSTHTRFSHSLGAMELGTKMVETIMRKRILSFTEIPYDGIRRSMRIICLWHDVGQGPFSHVSDRVFSEYMDQADFLEMGKLGIHAPHEYFGYRLMEEQLPTYMELLKSDYDSYTSSISLTRRPAPFAYLHSFLKKNAHLFLRPNERLVWFLEADQEATLPLAEGFKQVIDSDFDVDKMDYIQRDAYVTGVKFGHLDIDSLIANIEVDAGQQKLAFAHQAFSAVETFVLERYKLYRWLNFHHNVCFGDELMARTIELGLKSKVLDSDMFEYGYFEELAKMGHEFLKNSGEHLPKAKKTLDDAYVVDAIRSAKDESAEAELAKRYLSILECCHFFDALWEVDFAFDPLQEDILFRLRKFLHSKDTVPRKVPMDGETGKLEQEIADKIDRPREDVLIAHKPFEPIKQEITISINTGDGIKPIQEISAVVNLLQYRRVMTPSILKATIIKDAGKGKKPLSDEAKETLASILDAHILNSPQVFVPAFVYVRKIAKSELRDIRKKVFKFLNDRLPALV